MNVIKKYIQSNYLKGTKTVHTNCLFSITIKHNDEFASYANAVKDKMLNYPTIWSKLIFLVFSDGKGGVRQW